MEFPHLRRQKALHLHDEDARRQQQRQEKTPTSVQHQQIQQIERNPSTQSSGVQQLRLYSFEKQPASQLQLQVRNQSKLERPGAIRDVPCPENEEAEEIQQKEEEESEDQLHYLRQRNRC